MSETTVLTFPRSFHHFDRLSNTSQALHLRAGNLRLTHDLRDLAEMAVVVEQSEDEKGGGADP